MFGVRHDGILPCDFAAAMIDLLVETLKFNSRHLFFSHFQSPISKKAYIVTKKSIRARPS